MGWFKGKQQAKKARRQEKDAGTDNDSPETEKPAKQPARFSRWTQNQRDAMTARARSSARYTTRWAIMSGGIGHAINYDDPQIKLEWELCDIDNLRLVYKGRRTGEFLAKLPPECRALYYEKDPEGKTYAETVENPAFFIGFLRGIGILRRGNQKEIEKLIKEIEGQENAENET